MSLLNRKSGDTLLDALSEARAHGSGRVADFGQRSWIHVPNFFEFIGDRQTIRKRALP